MVRKNLQPTSMMKKAHKAIIAAVRKTLLEHKTKGLPIFIWQHNHVVRVPAGRITFR